MSLSGISANRQELLQIADAVAREKSIDKEIVIEAIEEAIQKAARTRYGAEHDIRVHIDPKTGETAITRHVTVVEDDAEEVNEYAQERLSDAKKDDKQAVVGKVYEEVLPPFEFGRVQTQMARQVVTGKVREAERERQYEEFKDRVGEIVNGVAKRVEYGNVIVDLGRGEGIMRRDQSIPRENVPGRRPGALLHLRRPPRDQGAADHAQPRARRLHGQAVRPGSAGGLRRRDRDPRRGPRSGQPRQDGGGLQRLVHRSRSAPASACAARVSRRWSPNCRARRSTSSSGAPDEATFLVNALAPAEVTKVVMDEEAGRVEVVVPDEQLQPRHRPARAERAAREPADRLADRHHDRKPGQRASPARVRRAHRPVPGSPGRRRGDRPAAGHRGLRHGRGRGLRRSLRDRRHRGLRRGHRRRNPGPRPGVSRQGSRRIRRQAPRTRGRGRRARRSRA